MANTLTSLTPDIYGALDVVSRELIGFIPSVARDPRADRVAKGATFRSPVTPVTTSSTTTPAMSIPAGADQTIGNANITLSVYQEATFSWNGEEQYAVNTGPGFVNIFQDQIAQCFRVLANNMENAIGLAAQLGASRAYGTAGTTPFADAATGYNGTVTASAQLRKILDDNGTPMTDRHVVLNTTAGANLRSLFQLTKANEAGTTGTLRQGTLLDLHGMSYRESNGIVTTTAGTGASYTTNTAGYAVGATAITLITGTGTVLAGDVITISGDTNKYVVAAGVAAPGVITLAAPGLRQAVPTSAKAVTVGAAYSANVGFSRNAILLATRLQIVPDRGDLATDRMVVTDPFSGISFEIAYYPGYRMGVYKVLNAYGVSVFKPEHLAVLLG